MEYGSTKYFMYKESYFRVKLYRGKVADKTWIMYKHTKSKTRNWWKKSSPLRQNYTPPIILKNTDPKLDHNTGGKWFNHGPKRSKENQLQSLELSCW